MSDCTRTDALEVYRTRTEKGTEAELPEGNCGDGDGGAGNCGNGDGGAAELDEALTETD